MSQSRRLEPTEGPGVYCIQAPNGRIKIGRSINVRARVRELETAGPHTLRFLVLFSADPKDELKFHRRFAHLRCEGEWFLPGTQLLEDIDRAQRGELL